MTNKKLNLLLDLLTSNPVFSTTDDYYVSVSRSRSSLLEHNTITLYPNEFYQFFTASGMQFFLSLAEAINVSVYFNVENGVPVVDLY